MGQANANAAAELNDTLAAMGLGDMVNAESMDADQIQDTTWMADLQEMWTNVNDSFKILVGYTRARIRL